MKPIVAELFNKIVSLYVTTKFLTEFRVARYQSLSQAR
jgi:hypothetical protein